MHPAPLAVMDYVGPALGALLFVAVMSLVAELIRRTLNAIILAGAALLIGALAWLIGRKRTAKVVVVIGLLLGIVAAVQQIVASASSPPQHLSSKR